VLEAAGIIQQHCNE